MTMVLEPARLDEQRTSSAPSSVQDPIIGIQTRLIVVGTVAVTSIGLVLPGIPFNHFPVRTTTVRMAASTAGEVLEPARAETHADTLKRVRESASLTWDQLARMFGVSRRAVHHWAAGENMSANNVELLAVLDRLIGGLTGETPDQRKAALFAVGGDGISPVDEFRQLVAASGAIVDVRPATQAALLGHQQ